MSYLKRKKGSLESSILSVWTEAKKDRKTCGMDYKKLDKVKTLTVAGKTYDDKKKRKENGQG